MSSTFSAFINNRARSGGAVAVTNDSGFVGGTFNADKSLFAFNTAAGNTFNGGGALLLQYGGGASLLQACTFSRNTASYTGNSILLIGARLMSVASSFIPSTNVDYRYPCSSDVSLAFGEQVFKSSFVAPGQLLPTCPLLNVVDIEGETCTRTIGDDQYTCEPHGGPPPPPRFWWTTA